MKQLRTLKSFQIFKSGTPGTPVCFPVLEEAKIQVKKSFLMLFIGDFFLMTEFYYCFALGIFPIMLENFFKILQVKVWD
jgi:hypothetical protein